MVGAAATTTTTVGTALPPTTDCGATTAYDGSDCGGSWDRGKARTTDVDDNPRGGDCHAKGAVNALNCSDGRGVPGVTRTATMHEQMSALALAAAMTTAIAHRPSPKRRRIAGSSRESCRKSSENSAEGEDHQMRCDNNGRTGRGWGGGKWRERWHRLRQRGGGVQLHHSLRRRPRPPRIQCPCRR